MRYRWDHDVETGLRGGVKWARWGRWEGGGACPCLQPYLTLGLTKNGQEERIKDHEQTEERDESGENRLSH